MKKGKELKINAFKNYGVTYGSVNNKNSKALYINVSTWANPKLDATLNYNRIIRDIDKSIRQTIYNTLSNDIATPFLKDRTIVDFDIRESGVKFGKKSFTNVEITLFMKYEIPINDDALTPFVDELIGIIIKTIFEKNKYFKFNKKKN